MRTPGAHVTSTDQLLFRRSAATIGLAVSLALALTSCSSTSEGKGSFAGSDSTSGTAAGTPEASAPSADTGGEIPAIDATYFPIAEGNTWVYKLTYSSAALGEVTQTQTVTKIVPQGEDDLVTLTQKFHYANGSTPDFDLAYDYLFHADGSLTVPYQTTSQPGVEVKINSGEIVWPTPEELEAGTPKTGSISATATAGGQTFDQKIDFTITGGPVESVTVPAGTYDNARTMTQDMTVTIATAGVTIPINTKVWFAKGVGMVKSSIPDLGSGSGSAESVLVSFTEG